MPDRPIVVSKPLAQIITFWRPGSFEWSWEEEYADIFARPETKNIEALVDAQGIGFLDHVAPVLLSNNGRVWDGHHRICIAIKRGIPSLMVELVAPKDEDVRH